MNCAHLILGLLAVTSASISRPIDIVRKDHLDVLYTKKSRSMPVLESELTKRSRTPSSAERAPDQDFKVTRYSLITIKGVPRKLKMSNMYPYIGGFVYHDPDYHAYFELQRMFVGDRLTPQTWPKEYIKEAVHVMRMVGTSPGFHFFPTLVDPNCLVDGQRYIVNEFRHGISFENLFNTAVDHPLPELMQRIRGEVFDSFPFYLAQLITIFEVLGDQGVFNGKVQLSNISLLANGNLELVDLRSAFRPEAQKRKYVTASMPYAPPEVRSGKHVGAYSHFFSLGALVYELTTGIPFDYERAVVETLVFPKKFCPDLQEIVEHLLTVNYERRIAALGKIKTSPYFQGIRWRDILLGEASPPINLAFD